MNTNIADAAIGEPLLPYVATMARRVGVCRTTAEKIAARGEIPIVRVGRLVKVRESAVLAYIAAAERRTAAATRRTAIGGAL